MFLRPNRYSMPVTGFRSRNHETVPEHSPSMGMGHLNTTSFLFDEEETPRESATSPDVKNYVQMTDDSFPILVRRDEPSAVSPAPFSDNDELLTPSLAFCIICRSRFGFFPASGFGNPEFACSPPLLRADLAFKCYAHIEQHSDWLKFAVPTEIAGYHWRTSPAESSFDGSKHCRVRKV